MGKLAKLTKLALFETHRSACECLLARAMERMAVRMASEREGQAAMSLESWVSSPGPRASRLLGNLLGPGNLPSQTSFSPWLAGRGVRFPS